MLILGKKIITGGLVRLRVRDAVHEDNCVADSPEQLGDVEIGDLRFFVKSICLNTPQWRRSLVPGKGMLVAVNLIRYIFLSILFHSTNVII